MKLVKPKFEIIPQSEGLEGIYQQIELAGRTCYKSEDKITEVSAKEFVEKMIKLGHTAMLEHGTVYLYIFEAHEMPDTMHRPINPLIHKYYNNKYTIGCCVDEGEWVTHHYITTNYRVLVENGWLDDLQYLCEPTEYHEKRTTVKFICDRGVSHEFVRHRVFSFAQESTRYCNYSKDKFDNELTFIIPCWIDDIEERFDSEYTYCSHSEYHHGKDDANKQWYDVCMNAEYVYNDLIQKGWVAQQARAILPNSLKTELIMTGFESDWNHFFELRCSSKAHPQAQELAIPLHKEMIKLHCNE